MKAVKYLPLIFLFVLIGCSKRTEVPVIDLKYFANRYIVGTVNIHERERGSIFLEGTDDYRMSDLKQINSFGENIYFIVKNQMKSYSFRTGKVNIDFKIDNSSRNFTSFDIDPSTGTIYALDVNGSMIVCVDLFGSTLYEMTLDEKYEYCDVRVIDTNHLLITVITIPTPVTFIINLENKSLKPLDEPSKKSFTPDKALRDSVLNGWASLYSFSKSSEGLFVKYLFDDVIYRYSANGKEKAYRVKNENVKYSVNKIIKGERKNWVALHHLWRLADNKWMIIAWTPFVYGGQSFNSLDMSLTDDDMHWMKSLDNISTFMIGELDTIYNIAVFYYTWFNEIDGIIFNVSKYSKAKGELPVHLKNHPNKNDILLVYYVTKDLNGL